MQANLLNMAEPAVDYSRSKVLVPLSGGINSAAVLCAMGEHHPDHRMKRHHCFQIQTSRPLIRAIEARWGKLTIDLAARADNAKAPAFITPEEDSLIQDWGKRIGNGLAFINPEFDDIAPWAAKCAGWLNRPKPALKGGIIKLVPASIGSEWFADNCEGKCKTIGLRPRIKFYGCHVLFKDGPLKGQRKCLQPSPVGRGQGEGAKLTECLGCASYPKDCMLTLWGSRFRAEPIFSTWRWDAAIEIRSEAAA